MSFTHISTRLGGGMSAAVLGKAAGTAGCFPSRAVLETQSCSAAGGGEEEIIAFQIFLGFFYCFQIYFFYFVEILTIKRKEEAY